MQQRLALRIESHDLANVEKLMSAFNLVGADYGEKPWQTDRKTPNPYAPISRIKGNDFTWEDAVAAVEIIKSKRDEIHARSFDPVFIDQKLQEVFQNGVRSNADLAVRMAEAFLSDLQDDLAA